MSKFLDGPAAGVALMLRRAPRFLRVVKSQSGKWDALDMLDDTPKPREEIHVYHRVSKATTCHILMRPRSQSGWYQMADYKLFQPQPEADDVFLNEDWQAWCYRTVKPDAAAHS